ncbi:Arrestin domain-containing protein 1 [Mortierella sp. AD011]|nr:Arrestin domain-containing protein 1 [Mortierella sp. AD010]KAF9384016.1 Arrestin domain-containing protein 1 [Mortierella sp. AD011]
MKKLVIVLVEDTHQETKPDTVEYMPGDTIAGHLTFNTNSSLKYTCIKIRFVGTVSTKVAKASEEVYVLNQQVALLGNPNNAEEFTLPEGKHSWPFEFLVPLHHIPSSGKYRHGIVKYTLFATISSKTFLGGMQDVKANYVVQVKDLVNCTIQPYSEPITVNGSSNTKPDSNKPKNLASATVQLSRSAYLKGQPLHLSINMAHPRSIQRDPGCWIQLLRKESYNAGKEVKEYSHVVASATYAVNIESGTNTGTILADLTIPDKAIPSMTTTKIVSIQYYIVILFDMRPRTGFMERRSRRTVNKKLRSKLLDAPGGFEVEIPIVIGTVSDIHHQHRPSPFSRDVASLTTAASNLSISDASNAMSLPPTSSHDTHTGYAALPVAYGRQASEPSYRSLTSTTNNFANRSRTLPSHQSSPATNLTYSKPLPFLPSMFINTSPDYVGSSSTRPPQPVHSISASSMPLTTSSQSSSSSSPRSTYSSVPPLLRPVPNPFDNTSMYGPNGYPREKGPDPMQRHINIQPPLSFNLPSPTAPQAVDLGLGPSSPGIYNHRFSLIMAAQGSSNVDGESTGGYFQYPPQPPRSGAASGSEHSPLQLQQQTPFIPESSTSSRGLQQSLSSSDDIEHERHSAPAYTQIAQSSGTEPYTTDHNKY